MNSVYRVLLKSMRKVVSAATFDKITPPSMPEKRRTASITSQLTSITDYRESRNRASSQDSCSESSVSTGSDSFERGGKMDSPEKLLGSHESKKQKGYF